MCDNRDTFYGGYGGTLPNGALMNQGMIPNMNPNMPGTLMPNQIPNQMPNQMNYYGDNINNRINIIEQNLKRLEYRISRLENPSGISINNEPDGNLYML